MPSPPVNSRGNWISEVNSLNLGGSIPGAGGSPVQTSPFAGYVVTGDLQGRSLRLGQPDIVRIAQQIQPDLVLGMPPMHIDWVAPSVSNLSESAYPGCQQPQIPCILNLTVEPTSESPSAAPAFYTGFNFSDSSQTTGKRTSTTSWGLSAKTETSVSISYDDLIDSGSSTIKNSAQYAYNHNVSSYNSNLRGVTDLLDIKSGFDDHVFFTQQTMNVYYYPILGQSVQGQNAYVEFSVPDSVTHGDVDAVSLDWYQPVHEPGNVLSYPWNEQQLQNQFANGDTIAPLTQDPPGCKSPGTQTETYSTTWTQNTSNGSTVGSSNAFSDDVSISTSGAVGIEGFDGIEYNASFDLGGSTSLSTLNEDTTSISATTSVSASIPAFADGNIDYWTYALGSYVFGQNSKTWQSLTPTDSSNQKVDISSSGPLFIGYMADPIPNTGSSDWSSSCGGGDNCWKQLYNTPDVGVNHPARWNWSNTTYTASFNPADLSGNTSPLEQEFYWMKGFFITEQGANGASEYGTSPNLTQATAGDQLTLTARVYNYSLVPTQGTVHVRFYGQLVQNGNLSGNAVLIGDTAIGSIPGFKSADTPNWTTASVPFNTTTFTSTNPLPVNLVFWVVVWMEGENGILIPEMPGHGLTASPDSTPPFQQITDVPIEPYSNNVGMYGVHTPFTIVPPPVPGAAKVPGHLGSISLTAAKDLKLGHHDRLTLKLRAADAAIGPVTVAYYDGNPSENGKMVDVQTIPYIDPRTPYTHKAFFSPQSCGAHDLYAQAWLRGTPVMESKVISDVIIHPLGRMTDLIANARAARIGDALPHQNLIGMLEAAQKDFEQHRANEANTKLQAFIKALTLASGKQISARGAARLISETAATVGCHDYVYPAD